jgi:hypothetical protein
MLFHHRAAFALRATARHGSIIVHSFIALIGHWLAEPKPEGEGWLPGLDLHQHKRLQRALSYELDDPAKTGLPSVARRAKNGGPPR